MKKILSFLAAGIIGGLVALGVYNFFEKPSQINSSVLDNEQRALAFAALQNTQTGSGFDFVQAAELSTPSVVYIKTTIEPRQANSRNNQDGNAPFPDFFDFFGEHGFKFDVPQGPQGASGSGVIITADGYIATNNHVVQDADKIEVTLNDKRTYVADLVGTDPTTDLALLKINEKELPFMPTGNSDSMKVGEWVIAVGNPMNLSSTVTAGIISAKGRSLNLLRTNNNQYAIENFIQTDAAINPGNSGGALVNTKGELIGINTAIASQTGSFIGYGFAIPINLAKKVLDDIKEFGGVQRGLLGVSIQDITSELAEKEHIRGLKGVYVHDVMDQSAAKKAGIKVGDIILKINNKDVNSSSALQEEVGKYRPGDKIELLINRNGETKTVTATLLNKDGNSKPQVYEAQNQNEAFGLVLENINKKDLEKLNLTNGVRVVDVKKGAFAGKLQKGFIITSIDKAKVYSVNNAIALLQNKKGGILIEGKNTKGETEVVGVLVD
ncbi:MAG: Do family serine endopeptidase [Bacteroidia bacterium]|nr:Do family serine endopeptidase [Bacteroidia bacterium]MCO5253123.1 Do family serine endopeptidase [Bacteroidota bacterium]